MDTVASNSLQAVDGVLESTLDRIDGRGIAKLASQSERDSLERFQCTVSQASNIGSTVVLSPSRVSENIFSLREQHGHAQTGLPGAYR